MLDPKLPLELDDGRSVFDGGNAHGFFVLRNSYVNAEPEQYEEWFVD